MNCFVIMPFAPEFDDVYVAIKEGVTRAISSQGCRCFRLDESRPAGRITDRLLQELRAASFCIADLTGNRANVMWEVGYAMALGCPTIILTQALSDLPFDIRDMQSLQYDRGKLSITLAAPLRRMIIDTISAHRPQEKKKQDDDKLVGQLLDEVADLKSMVAQAVRSWNPPAASATSTKVARSALSTLEGAWINPETGSHLYADVVRGNLLVPYCYGGNTKLDGVYYDWRSVGEYWFARFAWLMAAPAGFTFLKQESIDILRGAWWGNGIAWWSDDTESDEPAAPPQKAGVPATWRRSPGAKFPPWAIRFFQSVHLKGLPSRLTTLRRMSRRERVPEK
jgi:hypothetical protein